MPVQYISSSDGASDHPEALFHWDGRKPQLRILLWPHRSLPRDGFAIFIAITAAMLALPLLALLGSMAMWGLLPFAALAVAGIWLALMHSYRSGHMVEELSLWQDQVILVRIDASGKRHEWQANPYWVKLRVYETPVENYLTLRGSDREVELGAFLSPDERLRLRNDLEESLKRLRPTET